MTSATTTFEASERAARRVPLPAHNEDDEGCTLRRLVARGGILVHNDMRPFFVKKKQHRNVFNNNEREKKRAEQQRRKTIVVKCM